MADADTPSRQPSPAILVIGEFFSPEMSALRLCVENLVAVGCRSSAFRPAVPAERPSSDGPDWFPDLVVVCQHWPDEFTERDVRRLLTLYPLASAAVTVPGASRTAAAATSGRCRPRPGRRLPGANPPRARSAGRPLPALAADRLAR